jgi:hypothetical protein
MKDLYSNIIAAHVVNPVVGANSSAPAAVEVDLAGCNSAVFLISVGLEGSTLSGSNYWTWTMDHADDNGSGAAGSYANVAAADVQGVTPASGVVCTVDDPAEDNTLYKIGYIGGKRFVKITTAETGTGPNLPQAVIVIKGALLDAPPIA